MTRLVALDHHNRSAVLDTLRSDFGKAPIPPGEPGLAAPPRLHVMAELIAQGAHFTSANQCACVVDDGGDIIAVLVYIPHSLVLMAGNVQASSTLARFLRKHPWRVLMGDEPLANEALDEWRRRIWWVPQVRSRRQHFMVATGQPLVLPGADPAYRVAHIGDVDAVAHMAAVLHVDDEMGPPLSSSALANLMVRTREVIAQGRTWVIDIGGAAIAKFDIHNCSPTYGAQLSGVVVHPDFRGQGIGTRLVTNGISELLSVGIPQVTLHLRDGNQPAIRAYEKAGMRLVDSQLVCLIQ